MLEITAEDLWECAGLVYKHWAEAYDILKNVKAEKDDGSEDFDLFHKARLAAAIEAEAKWRGIKDRLASKLGSNVL